MKPLAGLGRSLNRLYENRNHDAYSNGEARVLQKLLLSNPKIILDVGANVGQYAEMAHSICAQAKIYSFEPVKATFEILSKKMSGNEQVMCIKKGLYKESRKVKINIYPGSEHSSFHDIKGVSYEVVQQEEIETTTGDQFMKEMDIEKVDLLKLDVEGAEMDALLGFSVALASQKIRLVQFEYGYINITSKVLLADYYDFFEKYGYRIGKIYPKSVEFKKYEHKHEDFIGPNFLAVHKDDTELIRLLQ
ncbi:MAG: FkbM family methyltransferase [Flammeovirgaceae bacterium]|nr:FkbM family methyltransferase [Flammeovirgaceae bacterium]